MIPEEMELDERKRLARPGNGTAIMAAYAEGLNILRHANVGTQAPAHDAETTPLRNPGLYQYDLNLPDITEVWRRGSVIASWVLDVTVNALAADPTLKMFVGRVSDSGEGRLSISAAIDERLPAYVLSAALYERFRLRLERVFADQLLSAMHDQFGGHLEKAGTARSAQKREAS